MDVIHLREPVSAWSHFAGLMLALPGTMILWRLGAGALGKRLSLLIYGASLAFCYAASTLYHGVQLPADRVATFARWDGVGIFALIAGSYTPMAWVLMRGRWRQCTLAAVWGVAIAAATLIAAGRQFSPWAATCVYLGMGWGCVFCYAEIARVVSHRALLPVVVGGVSYSVGAVLNLLKWPLLWPGIFGVHELFHLFVIAGSLAHYWFILRIVVPFSNATGEMSSVPAVGIPGTTAAPLVVSG
jgi:hemolysin III